MPKKPAQIKINLVPKDPFFETPVGKILKWALSVGRYIVIFTELVVIVSFVTRFNLDRQVTDLNGKINQKRTVIESYGTLEADVRQVQEKINQYQQIEQVSNLAEVFPKLSQITPRDVRLDELVISVDQVSLDGTALSQNSLNLLINNIQLSPDFRNVSVDQIETGDSQDPGFHFRLSATTGESVEVQSEPATQQNILDRSTDI